MKSPFSIDTAAMTLSALCVVHCLLLPLLASTLPFLAIWAENEWLHKGFILAALPLSAYAFLVPMRLRSVWILRALAALGLALLIAAGFVEALHDHEAALTVSGAICVASAHLARLWLSVHAHR